MIKRKKQNLAIIFVVCGLISLASITLVLVANKNVKAAECTNPEGHTWNYETGKCTTCGEECPHSDTYYYRITTDYYNELDNTNEPLKHVKLCGTCRHIIETKECVDSNGDNICDACHAIMEHDIFVSPENCPDHGNLGLIWELDIRGGNFVHYAKCQKCGWYDDHYTHWNEDGRGPELGCTLENCAGREQCEHNGNTEHRNDNDEHWQVCADCGKEISGTRQAHNMGEWKKDSLSSWHGVITSRTYHVDRRDCTECDYYEVDLISTKFIDPSWFDEVDGVRVIEVPGTDATCTEAGATDGCKCGLCNEWLEEPETIPATGHNPDSIVYRPAREATCALHGLNADTWECSDCYKVYLDEGLTQETTWEEIEIPRIQHNKDDMEHHERKEATCTEPGNIEYWYCPNCEKNYIEVDVINNTTSEIIGKDFMKIDLEDTIIPATGHDWKAWHNNGDGTHSRTCNNNSSHIDGPYEHTYDSTGHCTARGCDAEDLGPPIQACNHDGEKEYEHSDNEHWQKCAECGEEIPGTREAHNMGAWREIPISEYNGDRPKTMQLHIDGRDCEDCEYFEHTLIWDNSFDNPWIDKVDGVRVIEVPGTAATCTKAGKTNGIKCGLCNEWLVEPETIPAVEHNLEFHEAVEPTRTSSGNIAYYQCEKCGEYFKDNQGMQHLNVSDIIIAAIGTTPGTTPSTTPGTTPETTPGTTSGTTQDETQKEVKVVTDTTQKDDSTSNNKIPNTGKAAIIIVVPALMVLIGLGAVQLKKYAGV